MASEQDTPRPFDLRTVRDLVRLMSQHELSEIDLHEGDRRIRLRRGSRIVQPAAPIPALAPHVSSTPAASPQPPVQSTPSQPATTDKPASKLIEIKSPTVGTFFAQRDPGSPAFVTVGSRVTPTTVVCLIEAMKVFNDIVAECSGIIREVCVNNKDFVEFNTVLFRVDPAG